MNENPYADLLHLPHHQAENRTHLSMDSRAAQFSPYAALVGFENVIAETGRLTEDRPELSDSEKEEIDRQLMQARDALLHGRHPVLSVTYFVQDALKAGGAYETYTGRVKKMDTAEKKIVFYAENGISGGKTISMEDMITLMREEVDGLEENGC